MPITWRAGVGGRVDILFSDPYSLEESETMMKEIFAHSAPARPLRFLVDVREAAVPDTDFVLNAITFWQMHVRDMWAAKVAIVTATPRQVDMAQMSERSVQARDLPFTVRVFDQSQWGEAERWLTAS